MKKENQIELDETAMELCQKLKNDFMTDDIAYLCKLGLSLLSKKYNGIVNSTVNESNNNAVNENNNNAVIGNANVSQNNIPPVCTQKGMSEKVIESHMKRFNVTREEYNTEYLRMVIHYKSRGKELNNIEQIMFFWLRHYEKEKTIDQISIYHTKGYSDIIHDIGIPICVADSHLIRFNLNVDIYNKIVEYYYFKKQSGMLPNIPPAMQSSKKIEGDIYGLCKKYYNKNQEFLNELSVFVKSKKYLEERETQKKWIQGNIHNLANQKRVQFPSGISQPYYDGQDENGF